MIFVHSSFRTGSTYVWSCLRQSSRTVTYYEIFHEALNTITRPQLLEFAPEQWRSKHPASAPYFLEFLPLLRDGGGVEGFDPEMSYARFIPAEGCGGSISAAEIGYVGRLISAAEDRGKIPALTAVRSLGRLRGLKAAFPGLHVLLYRSLFQQWCSVTDQAFRGNPYFLQKILEILRISCHDQTLRDIREVFPLGAETVEDANAFYWFVLLHLQLYVQAAGAADLTIDLNRLQHEQDHRSDVTQRLAAQDVAVDFSGVANSVAYSLCRLGSTADFRGRIKTIGDVVIDRAPDAAGRAFGAKVVAELIEDHARDEFHAGALRSVLLGPTGLLAERDALPRARDAALAECQALRAERDATDSACVATRLALDNAQSAAVALQAERDAANDAHQGLRAAQAALEAQTDDLRARFEAAEADRAAMQAERDAIDAACVATRLALDVVQTASVALQAERDAARAENQALRAAQDALQAQFRELRAQCEAAQADGAAIRVERDAALAVGEARGAAQDDADAQCRELRAQRDAARAECIAANLAREAAEAAANALQAAYDAGGLAIAGIETERARLAAALDVAQSETEHLKTEAIAQRRQSEGLSMELAQMRDAAASSGKRPESLMDRLLPPRRSQGHGKPGVANAWRRKGDEARDARNWQEAAQAYERHLAVTAGDTAIWIQYGHVLKEAGDLKHALAAYERSRQLDAHDPERDLYLFDLQRRLHPDAVAS